MQIYVNGKLVSRDDAKISVFDHGFLYGDGVFEGIRVYEGNVFRLEEHIDRLFESAKTIALDVGLSRTELIEATLNTVAANGKRECYIRLIVSRGPGDLGIDPDKCTQGATVVIIVDIISLYPQVYYDNGIKLATSSVRRIPSECLDPRIKSLNYLNNIMAKIDVKKAGVPEAIMLNTRGFVAECTADNIFVVKDGALKTPQLLHGALGGVTRAAVLELAGKAGIPNTEERLALHDLYNADECFLTGTGAEIMPVIDVDGRRVNDGKPGPMTHRLLEMYRVLRVEDGARVDYAAQPATAG
jgi:branched-chain amino acid aminotransferase